MSQNSIEPMKSIQQRVTDKIKAEFAALIPDEMWATMIEGAIHEFVTDVPETRDRYNNLVAGRPSPFKLMIIEAITIEAKNAIHAEMVKHAPGWSPYGEEAMAEATKVFIEKHFAALMVSVQRGMIDMAVMQSVNAIRNGNMR